MKTGKKMNFLVVALFSILWISRAWSFSPLAAPYRRLSLGVPTSASTTHLFLSSFFGKFEEDDFDDDAEEDEDEDDEEDDDYDDLDDVEVSNFRTRMSSIFEGQDTASTSAVDELISYATGQREGSKAASNEWARPEVNIVPGTVLVANPAKFCSDFGGRTPSPSRALLSKYGLTLPPPADLGPDRRADLLPVLLVVETDKIMGCRAVLLNRRTGHLLGDLEQPPAPGEDPSSMPAPLLEKFCIQPLWFGGIDNVSAGLDMLHQCPAVVGTERLTDDGLYWGGDPAQAQDAMSDPSLDRVMTGFDFKFFVQSTVYPPGQLEKQIQDSTFFLASVSKEVLFKSRDRMGTRRACPLWTEIMELLDGEYSATRDQLYENE
jgi:hypothetical protein